MTSFKVYPASNDENSPYFECIVTNNLDQMSEWNGNEEPLDEHDAALYVSNYEPEKMLRVGCLVFRKDALENSIIVGKCARAAVEYAKIIIALLEFNNSDEQVTFYENQIVRATQSIYSEVISFLEENFSDCLA